MGGAGRYTVEERADLALGQPGIVLRDRETDAEARITPSLGANLVGLRLGVRGRALELLTPVPTEAPPTHGFGAPVLFPYPNRVRAGRYRWAGRDYQLPVTRAGHAIHGLVMRRPFTVVDSQADEMGASLTCSIAAADHPDLAEAYPFAFRLTLTYSLGPAGLTTAAVVENAGDEAMPFGLGFHPYFRVPLVEGGRREECRLQLWAPSIWELDADSIATGRRLPVPEALDPRGYPALDGTIFDTLYTVLALDDPGAGSWSSRYLDPRAGVEVVVVAAAAFREAILFAPLQRPVLSIEPYTCATDALNLQASGHDAGLLILDPGARWVASYRIGARAVTFDE